MAESALRPVAVRAIAIGLAAVTIAFVAAAGAFVFTLRKRLSAEVIPPCPVPNGVAATRRFDDAPSSLVRALSERVGEIVPAGAAFDATDVYTPGISTGKDRRLVFIWNLSNRWVVATERGGIGYSNPIFAFDVTSDGLRATLVEERVASPKSVCSTASSLLAARSQAIPAAPPKDMSINGHPR